MEFIIKTKKREEVIDITREVEKIVSASKIKEGICIAYVSHATAALTINENADPNIALDFLDALNKLIPQGIWRHDKIDNNGAAHIKAAIIGPDIMIPIKDSKLQLGTWQSLIFVELDGPRDNRRVIVSIISSR